MRASWESRTSWWRRSCIRCESLRLVEVLSAVSVHRICDHVSCCGLQDIGARLLLRGLAQQLSRNDLSTTNGPKLAKHLDLLRSSAGENGKVLSFPLAMM